MSTIVNSHSGGGPVKIKILNILALGVVLLVNTLATTGTLGGVSTGELSDSYPSLFTPAGYVFGIWGLIYTLLVAFVIYQVLPGRNDPRLERLGYLFALSCLFNSAWIFAWQYQQILLSWLLMLGILATLIRCYQILGGGRIRLSRLEDWTTRLPFSIYLGWITVATIANTTVLLLSIGFTGGSLAPLFTLLVIAAAVGIGYLSLRWRGDRAFNLVLLWAFVGIAVKQWGAQPMVTTAALIAAVITIAALTRGGGIPQAETTA